MPASEFVALADVLRGGTASRSPFVPTVPLREADTVRSEPADRGAPRSASAETGPAEIVAAAREARLFRARLADAFDDALARLLRELAADVLARELRLAPCAIAALARRVRAETPVVRLRVAEADAGREYDLPVVPDPELHAGDAVFELAGGALDARLGVRLASVLAAVSTTASDTSGDRGAEPGAGDRAGTAG